MAQQKPGVMLYFEMRNVFEELSNEKRGILVSAILDYSEHGIQPDFRGSLRIAWASIRHKLDRDDDNYARKSQVRRYAVYIRESKKDGVLPLPYEQWLASLPETSQPETSNDTNRYPTTTTTTTTTATATSTTTATATSTTTATSTDCCYMPAAGKPPRQPQRQIPPRYFANPPGSTPPRNRFAHPLSGRKSRFHSPNRSVPLPCGRILSFPTVAAAKPPTGRLLVGPTGAGAKPQSKLSPPPGSKFVVFSAAQCLY